MFEKNKPKVIDSWVCLYLLLPSGGEICFGAETRAFEEHILPLLLLPSIHFWESMGMNHPLYEKREESLKRLLEKKTVIGR